MRVCLINPPHPYLKQPTAQAPLGLLYVAAALKNKNIAVEILDVGDKYYKDSFQIPEADLYGITGTVLDRVSCIETSAKIKKQYPKTKVVIGGPISLTPQYLNSEFIDTVLQGEGEYSILDVIRDFPKLKALYKAERIKNLDVLPFPARDMIKNLGGNIFAYNKNYQEGGSTVLITSRGCPFNCAFCASPGIWNRKVYFRSIENVIEEIDEVIGQFGITQLRFSDDTLTLNSSRINELSDSLRKRHVIWRASVRVKPNSVDMFKMMYAGGCREVSFGVESADPNVLDVLCKGTTVADNYNGIVNAKKAGMVVRILFMIGTPGETADTVKLNINFLEKVKNYYDTIALTNFIPIPGSAIAKNPDKFNCKIIDSDIDHYNFYMWGPSGLNTWDSFIELTNLDGECFKKNKQCMRNYVINSGKSNRG